MLTAALRLPPRSAVPPAVRRQTAVGLLLAGGIVAAWVVVHLCGLFALPVGGAWWLLAPVLIGLQCWLSVGLFIVAHDAMHGSLAPFRPRLNRLVGRAVLMLYGGIRYDDLVARHFSHHRVPGTSEDPDFHRDGGAAPGAWFVAFMRQYLSPGQILRQSAVALAYLLVARVAPGRLLLFWAVPALLSTLQLFYFGTYLPHRRDETGFADLHRARSNDFSPLWSLATCFHFGYHHEHHADPSVPWWRLPARHRGSCHAPNP